MELWRLAAAAQALGPGVAFQKYIAKLQYLFRSPLATMNSTAESSPQMFIAASEFSVVENLIV
jgi:hypothetical protein